MTTLISNRRSLLRRPLQAPALNAKRRRVSRQPGRPVFIRILKKAFPQIERVVAETAARATGCPLLRFAPELPVSQVGRRRARFSDRVFGKSREEARYERRRHPRQGVYTRVTDQITAALELGTRPWHQPWSVRHSVGRITLPLRHNGVPYAEIMLWGAAVAVGYVSPFWMTFKQALELNAHVRKCEKASLVVYANKFRRTEQTDSREEVEREIPFRKGYSVFNVEQIDGLPAHYYVAPEPRFDAIERIEHAEAFFRATGIEDEWFEFEVRPRLKGRCTLIRFADDAVMAFEDFLDAKRVLGVLGKRLARYGLTLHPDKTRFVDFRNNRPNGTDHAETAKPATGEGAPIHARLCADATLRGFPRRGVVLRDARPHESCHWTRHPWRLDRDFGRKCFGDEGYV